MMRFLAGIVTVLVVVVVVVFAAVWWGYVPAAADTPKPSPLERWAAHRSLNATLAREGPKPPYPFGPATDAVLTSGAKLYLANCAVCHGSGGSEQSTITKGMYIRPPQFTRHGVDDDPEGKIYWQIEHGIRFTGMPSFKGQLSEEQIWQITYFLKRATADLPPAAAAVWNQPHGD